MLRKLSVTNYAIIDYVELYFDAGLTVITGETGAGKSIILGAMDLILGERASADVLRDASKKCVVEAVFNIEGILTPDFFKDNEIDYEPETIIRREIAPGGKSRAFVNDTPVNLGILRTLTKRLVDIHRPHQTLDLTESFFQTSMLDALSNQHNDVLTYRSQWKAYNDIVHEINSLEKQQQDILKEQDFLQFQFNELEQAQLVPGEQEQIEDEYKQLEHAGEIKAQLAGVYAILNNNDINVLLNIKEALRLLQHVHKYTPAADDMHRRLQTATIELQDLADETERLNDAIQDNPERLKHVQERLDIIYRLQKKHHVSSIENLLELKDDIQKKLGTISYQSERLDEQKKEKLRLEKELHKQCAHISQTRHKTASLFEGKVNAMFADVGLPHARLQITIETHNTLTYNGYDRVEFLFAANKGAALRPIADVASVGEMSRLMLCIKSVVGTHTHLPTMFFDEIDTGISGQTAIRVGLLLSSLAQSQQIITITHLPQIAARGQTHFYVYKEDDAHTTFTRVRQLGVNDRVIAIAQMLSGAEPTQAAIKNAKELLA